MRFPRQLTAHEVARSLTLAVVEVAAAALGGEPLLDPDPRDDHVTHRLEVTALLSERCLGVAGGPTRLVMSRDTLDRRCHGGGEFVASPLTAFAGANVALATTTQR